MWKLPCGLEQEDTNGISFEEKHDLMWFTGNQWLTGHMCKGNSSSAQRCTAICFNKLLCERKKTDFWIEVSWSQRRVQFWSFLAGKLLPLSDVSHIKGWRQSFTNTIFCLMNAIDLGSGSTFLGWVQKSCYEQTKEQPSLLLLLAFVKRTPQHNPNFITAYDSLQSK